MCAALSCPVKQKTGVRDASLLHASLLLLPVSQKGRKQWCGCWSGFFCSVRALLTLLVGPPSCPWLKWYCLWGKRAPPPLSELWGSAVPCSCSVGHSALCYFHLWWVRNPLQAGLLTISASSGAFQELNWHSATSEAPALLAWGAWVDSVAGL